MHSSDGHRPTAAARETADAIAIQGLGFLANDEEEFLRFLALSGLTVGELRQAAADPAFLAGVLDFILGHEKTLMSFAAAAGIDPASVGKARRAYDGTYSGAE